MIEIKVWPRDESMRKHLSHPSGAGFANFPDGTPWPRDQFTRRRINEGAVLIAPPKPPMPAAEPQPSTRRPYTRRPSDGV